MKFFLSGGGDFDNFKSLDRLFISLLNKNDQLLVIPYACDPADYEDIQARVDETYNLDGSLIIELFSDAKKIRSEFVHGSKAIFIEGGNTFDLITTVRSSNLETVLKSVEDSKIFYADSAGAILLGKDVSTAFFGDDADEDEKKLQDYRGLDLLDSWTVHAHYTPEDDDSVQNFVYESGTPVLALFEETGIYIDSGFTVKVISSKPLAIFTAAGKTLVESHQEINLKDLY